MRLWVFEPQFREDLIYWVQHDHRIALKSLHLVESVMRHPFRGEGKPEPLRGLGPDVWSRRIAGEHRTVYLVEHAAIRVLQCRYHY